MEGTTALLGAVLDVTDDVTEEEHRSVLSAVEGELITYARGLTLNTGEFLFEHFSDVSESESISGGISLGVSGEGATARPTFGTSPFAYSYENIQAITRATVGDGLIKVRNVTDGEEFDFRSLNRNVDNVQEIIRNKSFELNLPAIEVSEFADNIRAAREFGQGLSREAGYARHMLR